MLSPLLVLRLPLLSSCGFSFNPACSFLQNIMLLGIVKKCRFVRGEDFLVVTCLPLVPFRRHLKVCLGR